MKRLTHSTGLAVVAGLALLASPALGATAEARTPKKKENRRGVITLPVAYDKKTKRLSTAVVWWSTAHGGSHRTQLVTTDLDVVTPAKLAAVQARIKSRLESGELVPPGRDRPGRAVALTDARDANADPAHDVELGVRSRRRRRGIAR